jgi:hypothetical protein
MPSNNDWWVSPTVMSEKLFSSSPTMLLKGTGRVDKYSGVDNVIGTSSTNFRQHLLTGSAKKGHVTIASGVELTLELVDFVVMNHEALVMEHVHIQAVYVFIFGHDLHIFELLAAPSCFFSLAWSKDEIQSRAFPTLDMNVRSTLVMRFAMKNECFSHLQCGRHHALVSALLFHIKHLIFKPC